MRTNTDRLTPIDRERGTARDFTGPKIRQCVAAGPSAERKSTGSGSDPDISARQIFWGARS